MKLDYSLTGFGLTLLSWMQLRLRHLTDFDKDSGLDLVDSGSDFVQTRNCGNSALRKRIGFGMSLKHADRTLVQVDLVPTAAGSGKKSFQSHLLLLERATPLALSQQG